MAFFRLIMAMGLLVLAACNSNSSNVPIKIGTSAEITNTVVSCDTSKVPKNGNIVFLQVTSGCIAIQLLPELAPNHVKRITELVKKGFYDGIVFHRVIDGFMAQTGDPTGTGRGGSDLPNLKAEFSDERFVRGTLGMARSRSNDSANSQFFIMFAPGDFLNGKYTVFGKVIQGMEHVERIKKGDQADNGAVSDPDKIIKMQMAPNS
jgi:peptidylprolyl isomerase